MNRYSLTHLSDQTLLRDLAAAATQERGGTATFLAHIAEVEVRKLYLPAAHPSMYSYCVHELHLSEGSARKRIHAARTARQFPEIFAAVADGRLHLSAVILLAPHLTPENADGLLAAATHQTKAEIERLIAERFAEPDAPLLVQAIAEPAVPNTMSGDERAPGRVDQTVPGQVDPSVPRPPMAPRRLALYAMIRPSAHDKLRYAQELLSHQIAPGDVGEVIERALDALIPELEQRKFAATSRPRQPRSSGTARHVPAHVKRAVWERDGGQCTFVSESGRRCLARTMLEFDHVHEVARGWRASVSGIRLRCRAHNQYGAERTFGVEFMRHKREAARERQEARRRREAQPKQAEHLAGDAQGVSAEHALAHARRQAEEVIPWLRALGIRADLARQAAALCESIPGAPLEQRVRRALSCFGRGTTLRPEVAQAAP